MRLTVERSVPTAFSDIGRVGALRAIAMGVERLRRACFSSAERFAPRLFLAPPNSCAALVFFRRRAFASRLFFSPSSVCAAFVFSSAEQLRRACFFLRRAFAPRLFLARSVCAAFVFGAAECFASRLFLAPPNVLGRVCFWLRRTFGVALVFAYNKEGNERRFGRRFSWTWLDLT
ncbi:MAG: hypothetical protein J6K25_08445 [Thermoguttaceae bacterium]|nr:hypothetical protein [Thermoguttaceae bacterium]